MHTGQPVTNELLRDMSQAVPIALPPLGLTESGSLAHFLERRERIIGHAAIELAIGPPIEGAPGRIRSRSGDAGELERLAVEEMCVPTAVLDADRMLPRDLVQIMNVDLAPVLHLRVIVEISLHPETGWRLLRTSPELLHDAGDGDEFNLVGITDQHIVEEHVASGMIVAINESRDDRHLLRIKALGRLAG